jgi:hypothetical protein
MELMTQAKILTPMDFGMHWIAQVRRVLLALRARRELQVQLVQQVRLARMVLRDQQVLQVQQVLQDSESDQQDLRALTVQLGLQGQQEQLALQELTEPMVLPAQQD